MSGWLYKRNRVKFRIELLSVVFATCKQRGLSLYTTSMTVQQKNWKIRKWINKQNGHNSLGVVLATFHLILLLLFYYLTSKWMAHRIIFTHNFCLNRIYVPSNVLKFKTVRKQTTPHRYDLHTSHPHQI